MIKTRQEACAALGLSVYATTDQIKTAYKELVKKYHPDVTGKDDATIYNTITEAYQFLISETNGKVLTHSRVVGKAKSASTYGHRASNAEYTAFQKKAEKAKQRKAEEFEKKQKEFAAKYEKQEADYKRAMEAIDAIRVARAIQSMVWANGLGKDNGDDRKEDW